MRTRHSTTPSRGRHGARLLRANALFTHMRNLAAIAVFVVAVLGGEWIVHQLEYLIEYGSRFGPVMSATPHRVYMAPLGAGLALAATVLLTATSAFLLFQAGKRRRLVAFLPARLRGRVTPPPLTVPRSLLWTVAAGLATCQIAVYLAQENLESASRGLGWPGIAVLVARQHATVMPLHLLIAACVSVVVSAIIRGLARSRRAVRMVQALVRLWTRKSSPPRALVPTSDHVPNLRLVAGKLSLRSPPRAA